MDSLARSVRFLVGALMVAAGVALAVPAGQLVATAWASAQPAVAAPSGVAPPVPQAVATPSQAPAGQWLVPEDSLPPPVTPRADYAPPPPPDRLPPAPAAVVAGTPALNGTYRSTLQVPPPPLLDSQAMPPSAAAWTTAQAAQGGAAPSAAPMALASTYVIRDGDDLASIAARFYGHPGAAGSLWEANRDRISSPELLPIGAEIRLPPPWTVQGTPSAAQTAGRAIEPPPTAVTPRHLDAMPVSSPWLDGRVAPASAGPPPHAPTVRLGPGDTLETLAQRFYGDPRAASRIWEANRDRLRSPELVVPGMELRLP